MANGSTRASADLFDRMTRVMPAGSTRTTTYYQPYPIAIAHGSGYVVTDVDGNEYLDLLGNYSALVHGQAHPAPAKAIAEAAAAGYANPAPSVIQAELAERICDRVPTVRKVRFMNSGTEPVMIAIRAARAITGRDRVVKVVGATTAAGSRWPSAPRRIRTSRLARPTRPWRAGAIAAMLSSVRYNDFDQLRSTFEMYGDEIAAIIVEPVLGHVVEAATQEYLQLARSRHGKRRVVDLR